MGEMRTAGGILLGFALVVAGIPVSPSVASCARREPSTAPAAFEVVDVYPHDPAAYTQGLYFDAGVLYEGTGRNGRSELRVVTLATGDVQRRVPLPDEYFGEGIARLGDRIYQLTWLSNVGFIYDAATLERIGEFHYPTDGWGLTADDRHLIMSDGSANLYFIDPDSSERVRTVAVHDASGPVTQLNELELIDGHVFANIWHSDDIVKISPATGEVVARIDFSSLLAGERPRNGEAVLNGIAWDPARRHLFLTGKLWPKLFEVRLIEAGGS